jgi:hypothetical protein
MGKESAKPGGAFFRAPVHPLHKGASIPCEEMLARILVDAKRKPIS